MRIPARLRARVARSTAVLALALAAALGADAVSAEAGATTRRLEFLGEAALAPTEVRGMVVGGLSALAYDAARDVYYAVSDDPSERAPARFYTLEIDLRDGRLETGDVVVTDVKVLRTSSGETFAEKTLDPEGLALSPARTLYISSEGHAENGVAPWIREFSLDGLERSSLSLDRKFVPGTRGWLPGRKRRWGVRHNLAFESLTLSPGGSLLAATENALHQDGPRADLETGSPARIVRYDASTGKARAEYLYWTEPVPSAAVPADGFRLNGLVELLALDENRLLALERAYSVGVGNQVRLFEIDLEGAADVSGLERLGRSAARAVEKTFLLDFAELGIPLENLEAMSFGPRLADGRQTILMVSDDNFAPDRQTTQVLAFAWCSNPVTVSEIQGAGHRSPLDRQWVFDLDGIVTATDASPRSPGLWLQEVPGSLDPGSSSGLFVSTLEPPALAPGDRVRVAGRVLETGRAGALSVTQLAGGRFRRLSAGNALPRPVPFGHAASGKSVPRAGIDDDGLTLFEPTEDAIDFFESLEGMLVEIGDAVVVGPGTRFGDCVVVAGDAPRGERTARGGLLLTPTDAHPERIVLARPLPPTTGERSPGCTAAVGERFVEPVRGVLHYDFGTYRLIPTQPLPRTEAPLRTDPPLPLRGGREHLTVATYNLWNLEPADAEGGRLTDLARSIVDDLGAPDVLAVQEIQDASGPEDDGVVSGEATFEALVEAISAAGGPRYEYRQIDPGDGEDGGQPGANIRVGFLIDPERVRVPDRARGSTSPPRVELDEQGPFLAPNPGRLVSADGAFGENPELGYEASRKPLTLEIEFCGRRVFLVNLHLRSKRADDRLFGDRQPPVLHSEEQRSEQAEKIRLFVEEILASDPEAAVIVLGDLNEYVFRAPLAVLTGDVLVNLVERLEPEERYTYVYQGNSVALDHLLVSDSLSPDAQIQAIHVNADRPHGARVSDHDPLLARLHIGCR